jgi:hypothetical protein
MDSATTPYLTPLWWMTAIAAGVIAQVLLAGGWLLLRRYGGRLTGQRQAPAAKQQSAERAMLERVRRDGVAYLALSLAEMRLRYAGLFLAVLGGFLVGIAYAGFGRMPLPLNAAVWGMGSLLFFGGVWKVRQSRPLLRLLEQAGAPYLPLDPAPSGAPPAPAVPDR